MTDPRDALAVTQVGGRDFERVLLLDGQVDGRSVAPRAAGLLRAAARAERLPSGDNVHRAVSDGGADGAAAVGLVGRAHQALYG